MRTFLLISWLCITLCTVLTAQKPADLAGMWKVISPASGIKLATYTPTYLLLKSDSTYVSGIDSTKSDPLIGTTHGSWSLTTHGEIKLIYSGDGTVRWVTYYTPVNDWQYRYQYEDQNGIKTRIIMLETEIIIEKVEHP